MRRLRWFLILLTVTAAVGLGTHYAVDTYVLNMATRDVRDILLSHRGVHLYIQRTMHPEFYRARHAGEISSGYYAPEVLSSSFAVRVLHSYYNEEREKAGLPPVYYKLAAESPRNPVNKADARETRILEYFRQHPQVREYQAVEEIQGKKYLVVAMPFLRTESPCLVCHGSRNDAPAGLQARYSGEGGFGEKVGQLRAIESLRVPLEKEGNAALVASLATLVGFGAMGLLLLFNRSLKKAVVEKTGELASRERTFRRLLDAADAVPFEYSPSEQRYTYVGKQFQRLFGQDPSFLRTAEDWDQLVHPEDRNTELSACREATQRGEDHSCKFRVVRSDGTSLIVHQSVNVVREEGKPPAIVGFIHDVTAITRNEDLQRARVAIAQCAVRMPLDDLIRTILDKAEALTNSGIGFLSFVREDKKAVVLQQWSTNTEKVCGLRGKGNSLPLEHAGVWADSIRTGDAVIHNDYAAVDGRNGLPEGHVALTRELVVPMTHAGTIVAVIGVGNKTVPYDGTDASTLTQFAEFAVEIILRKRAEEENDRIQTQLAQSQKVEAIGQLAGGIAHDFNNMLSVILGNVELALDHVSADSTIHGELIEIQKAADRSAAITKQLLGFARRQISSPKAVNLNDAVEGMLKILGRLIGEDVDLVWRPHSGLWTVQIDPAQVDQILANLAANARDAITGVGTVTIETLNVTFDEEHCQIHPDFTPGNYVLLSVSDSGQGIAKQNLEKIFEPFFTTKEIGQGTGLGLSTVFGVVKQNGGFIQVYSELGHGSTFKVYLPEKEGHSGASSEEVAAKRDLRGAETVLLVEDEPAILELGARALKEFGYGVLVAENPEEALTVAENFPGRIDLLVTDVVMPKMNGRELAQRLKRSRPDTQCLYMSGYTADVIVHQGILDEGIRFLPKPFSTTQLASVVREILDRRPFREERGGGELAPKLFRATGLPSPLNPPTPRSGDLPCEGSSK